MKKQVKLTYADLPEVMQIRNTISKSLLELPKEIFYSEKFGLMLVQALMNMLCGLTQDGGVEKEVLLRSIEDIWEARKKGNVDIIN